MDSKDLLSKLSSRGDIGAAALGFALGFAVDVFWFPEGMPSATAASVFAVGAVGVKNSMQAFLEAQKPAREKKQRSEKLKRIAESLRDFAREGGHSELDSEISVSRELWDKGILDDSDFSEALESAKGQLRDAYLSKYRIETRRSLQATSENHVL